MHLNSRNLVCCDEEQLEFDFDTNRANADARNYNSTKFSQAELRKLDIPDAAVYGNDFVSHSSIPGSSFKNIQQSSSALSFVIDPNAGNLPPFPSEVQSYSNSIPSDLLVASIQSITARDSAAFLASQLISSRYSSSASSIKNATASKPEISPLLSHVFGRQPFLLWKGFKFWSLFCIPSILTGLAWCQPCHWTFYLKEHFSAHSYSQTGYLAIPQGHTYAPFAVQQAYLNGNMFHESHGGMKSNLPHYRRAGMSSFPLSGFYSSDYQSLGNSADIPGSFLHNLSAGPAGSKAGYADFLRSQYRDEGANFIQLQPNDVSARWDYGHGSQTISTIMDSAYYSLRGQNHLLAGYQQGQLHSQLHGAFGYPGVYNSHAGITIEKQQQQKHRDMILNGSQGLSSKHLPQIWQRSY
ncbi:uncharacterized protein LOC111299682 [Durio zibethinus]|uniref:Uncharacterized protein LOC111299682 n=1 Tax=Durio zibethinus TaxID=66656 RepID=A0A6P5ZD49_DURZI|nr:uncharacterized protein LOC111299682 [Durio zibethinus]XP_022750769.1 uncharacterized protein LOC111299682 [Durio zibethinus]XP_022750770.1 uncharacterized protein LOC111299682 [Durio zibethinus]